MPKLNLIASFYWLCLAQKVVSGDDLYRKVGGEIVLKPDESTVPDTITSILWKHGKNKVADWDKAFSSILDFYATFKERTTLDLTTGELKISGLMKTDSGVYSAMFNGKLLDKTYQLSVIKAVPKPTITSSCNTNKTSCTLTCEGDTTDAEPVAYSWKVGDGLWEVRDKQMNVSKSNTGKSTNSYKYICMLENSVSSEVSEPVGEVFGPEPSEVGGVGVGVVVVVIILVLVANVITGIWWVWKKKKGYPEDTWIYFLRMFCSRFCGDAGNNQNSVAPDTVYHAVGDIQVANGGSSVVLSGVAVDTVYSTVMEKSPRDYSMNQSNNNQSTNTAKGSDGVQPYKEVLLTDITKTNEDDADKAEKGQENGGSNDTTKTVVSVGPGGNDKTKTDVSVGPGGNDKTKADVSVGPGGNDEIKTYVSVGPGGNDEIKTDVSVGPRGNDDTKADVSVGPGGNDDTKADVSVGPGGNDETKTDGSVGPGGNDKTKADVSVGPGGNDETKADVSVGPGGDINSAEKGEANGEESKLLNENTVNHHNDNGDGAEEENSVL